MQSITKRVAQVFWGLAIVAFDIQVGRFDVFSDFVGYVLIALGAAGLVGWSSQFQVARLLAWTVVPFSAALMVFNGSFLKLIWMVSVALDGALMWFLLGGVMEFAQSRGRLDWVGRASICRGAYLVLLGVGVILSWIALVLPTVAMFFGGITLAVTLFVYGVILYLLHQVKREAAIQPGAGDPQPEEVEEAA